MDHVGRKKGLIGIKHPQAKKGHWAGGPLSWMSRLERLIRGSMGDTHMFSEKIGLAGERQGRLE